MAHLTGDPEKGYHQWHFEGHCLSDAEKLSLAETVLQQVPEAVRRLSGFGKERK